MDKRVSRHEDDRLSNLPESLLCRIMLNLRTKDVVQSCVLSKTWRNLWRYVPALNVSYRDFEDYDVFVSFVNMFLGLNRESCFQSCKLSFHYDKDKAHVTDWINIVTNRKVKYLEITDGYSSYMNDDDDNFQLPPAVYTCKSLVSLELQSKILANPELISLPFLKVINLSTVKFANVLVLEKLISSCPVIESVFIDGCSIYDVYLLRVCSQSLLSFKHFGNSWDDWEELQVEIDAPKLEYLRLFDLVAASFRIKNLESLVEADINIFFDMKYPRDIDDLPKIHMIRDFFQGISCIKKLFIHCYMVHVIFEYVRCGQCLPIFHNLSFLHLEVPYISDESLKKLSTFLESCPNLKSLVVDFDDSYNFVGDGIGVVSRPKCLLTSLEYVKIGSRIKGDTSGMKLVSYFLENSAILKKLTLHVAVAGREKIEEFVVFKELLSIKRLSPSCQVVVL